MNKTAFYGGEMLLPKEEYREKFAVVACDQFTSEPEYWEKVASITKGVPSAYHMMFPEVYLGKVDFEEKITSIQKEMEAALSCDVFEVLENAMVYVRRQLRNGTVRKGIVGMLDLEHYDYHKGAKTLIRASEGTVLERIPPRVQIRKDAALEMPHVLILIDDPDCTVVEPLDEAALQTLYRFPLMMNGGDIEGKRLGQKEMDSVAKALEVLLEKSAETNGDALLFAVGDGNHSLASAKECYEQLKKEVGEEAAKNHPARYAMVEIENIHDEAQQFEAIHRVVFSENAEEFVGKLKAHFAALPKNDAEPMTIRLCFGGREEELLIENPDHTLAVGAVQKFLDSCSEEVDYIHGDDTVRKLAAGETVGILLPVMEKSDFFRTILEEGALPRKTFSMGEASEKRYYLECRKIR